jgi:hypothetical protein
VGAHVKRNYQTWTIQAGESKRGFQETSELPAGLSDKVGEVSEAVPLLLNTPCICQLSIKKHDLVGLFRMRLYMDMQKCLIRRIDAHRTVSIDAFIFHVEVRSPAGIGSY